MNSVSPPAFTITQMGLGVLAGTGSSVPPRNTVTPWFAHGGHPRREFGGGQRVWEPQKKEGEEHGGCSCSTSVMSSQVSASLCCWPGGVWVAGASPGFALLKPPWDTLCCHGRPVPRGHPSPLQGQGRQQDPQAHLQWGHPSVAGQGDGGMGRWEGDMFTIATGGAAGRWQPGGRDAHSPPLVTPHQPPPGGSPGQSIPGAGGRPCRGGSARQGTGYQSTPRGR